MSKKHQHQLPLRAREGIKRNIGSHPEAEGLGEMDGLTKSSPTQKMKDDHLKSSSMLDTTEVTSTRLRHWDAAHPKPVVSSHQPPEAPNESPISHPGLRSQSRPYISEKATQPADGSCSPPCTDINRTSPKTEPPNSKLLRTPWLLFALVVLVIGVVLVWPRNDAPPPIVGFADQAAIKVSAIRWQEEVAALAKRFPYQRMRLWKVLRATVSRMLLESRQPAVVLLLASEAQRDDASCVLRAAADAVLNATRSPARPLRVDGATLGALDLQEAKGRLNTELGRLRGGDGVAVFIVEELQQLQPLTAMLLHGYCDNDNAPRKKAVFLLSMVTSRIPPGDADASLAVEHTLWQSWGKVLGEDIFHALLARIAGSVATVADEGSELLCHKAGQ